MLERGNDTNTFSHFPTRKYRVVIDPDCFADLLAKHQAALQLVVDLRQLPDPVEVALVLPAYAAQGSNVTVPARLEGLFIQLSVPPREWSFRPDKMLYAEASTALSQDTDDARRIMSLLTLADSIQADCILSRSALLGETRYGLYQHHLIVPLLLSELDDWVEIIAHGHGAFWSTRILERRLPFDTYYQVAHWKAARYSRWLEGVLSSITQRDLQNNLRSALLNRFPYLLYARDMVRFYEFQRNYFTRRELMGRFGLAVGYHINAYYLLLWGMLDQMTVIAKYRKGLRLEEQHCGIRKKDLWRQYHEPGLESMVQNGRIGEGISLMADVRHQAAHSAIPIPSEVLMDTDESKQSDEEIRQIVRREKPFLYRVLPPSLVAAMEPQMISQWRVRHMKRLAPSMVVMRNKQGPGGYMRDPVISIDADLAHLVVVMDAFLVCLFGGNAQKSG